MGRYADWSHVVARYGNAVAGDAGDAELEAGWLAGAEDEIDARLGNWYTTPFSPVPGIVRDLVVDITYYKMTIRQGTEELKESINERIQAIADGSMVLGGVERVGDFTGSGTPGRRSSFGPDAPENWSTDDDWVEAAVDERL
jgi:phage gp36-like protein